MKKKIAKKMVTLLTAVALAATLLTGCGSGSEEESSAADTEETAEETTTEETASEEASSNEGVTLTVGSKPITESYIMGEMASLLLEDAGFTVEREFGLGSSSLAHEALLNHDIDLYLEYNGTALVALFGKEAITDSEECNAVVKEEYEKIGVTPLEPIGFNNTYCITVTSEFAQENNLTNISDLAAIADTMTIGSAQEFIPREDGLLGMEAAYGFEFGNTIGMDPGLMYEALGSDEVDCVSGFATDGQIGANGYINLVDDKKFFPPYDAMYVVDSEVLSGSPDIETVLNQLAGYIDDATMSQLNYRVDSGEEEYDEVAKDFLVTEGFIEE